MPSPHDMESRSVPPQTPRMGRRAPPFMRWDQRGRRVLQATVKLTDGSTMRVMLDTDDAEIAQQRVRPLIVSAIADGLLPADSRPARLYGVYDRPEFWAEMSRLSALRQAQYDAERPAAEKRFGLPVWIIDRLAKRAPRPVGLAAYRQRRFRARERGEQTPMGTSWHHRAGRGKCFFVNGRVMNARIHVDGRVYQWSLGIDAVDAVRAQKRAARIMAPVRLAARRVRSAAAKVLDCSPATVAAAIAKRTLACQKFAHAILEAGGPKELADFVLGARPALSDAEVAAGGSLDGLRFDGPKEEVSTAVLRRAAVAEPRATLTATERRLAAERKCEQLLIERYEAYVKNGRKREERPLKDKLRNEMTRLIPGLSARSFDKCWKATALAQGWDWTLPGQR